MSISHALQNAYTGLNVTGRQAEVTANNIANANTVGFQRREAELEAQVLSGRGAGVRVSSVERAVSPQITADRRRAEADYGEQKALTDAAATIFRMVGDVDDVNGLFQKYANFEDALEEMANSPESTLARNATLLSAQDVAEAFNDLNTRISDLRYDADRAIQREVDQVNAAIEEVHDLNMRIVRDSAVGADSTEFEAQRDRLIDQIAEIVPIETLPQNDGRIFLASSTGAALLTTQPQKFEFSTAPTIDPTMNLRAGAPGALSGLTLNGADVTPDETGVQTIATGSLRGHFEVRDRIALDLQTQVDALAGDLIARFEAAEPTGTIPVGESGLFTDNQLANSGAPGLAGRLQVNDGVIPPGGSLDGLAQGIYATGAVVSGDNTHEIRLYEAMTTAQGAPGASGVTGSHSAAELIAQYGSIKAGESLSADTRLTAKSAQISTFAAAEVSATGVDLDYELQNLTLIQNSYAANARVLQVVDQMLQTLLEI